ncbi:MAG: hypothetical protein PF638_01945 [Candidatus Delongbacteria bacterium]|jgi:hypothetical protein|nr:hypothetical protein [Candidatus Delongbacteria bacterium]
MKYLLYIFTLLIISNAYASNSKVIYVGILQPDGVSEYDSTSIKRVHFNAWLAHNPSEVISKHDDLPGCTTLMLATRGCAKIDLQYFSDWNVGDELVVGLIDSNYAKTVYSFRTTWEIDDDSSDYAGLGMDPLIAGTGAPFAIYPRDYPGLESPPNITVENDSLTISWDSYSDVGRYSLYSSNEPYDDFELEEQWIEWYGGSSVYKIPIIETMKFYRVTVDY